MTSLARVADSGFHDAAAYDAHRPSYGPDVVDAFLGRLHILDGAASPAPLTIVEIGAGTGKFTELLSRRAAAAAAAAATTTATATETPPSGAVVSVVAIEPHAQMRAQLAAKDLPHVRVVDGHAADLAVVADASADAVVVAQAFHWFAHAAALAEIHRVLKPGARVGVIWNIEDYNKPPAWPAHAPYEQALNDLVLALGDDGSPRFRNGRWQQAFADAAQPTPGRPPLFAPLADDRRAWAVRLTPDALWRRLCTLSQVANLPVDPPDAADATDTAASPAALLTSRAVVRRRFDAIMARDDVPRTPQGELTIHAVTYFAWTPKLAGPAGVRGPAPRAPKQESQ